MEYISNGDFRTGIGFACGLPVVKWEMEISEDISIKWLHGFNDWDISGRLAFMMPRKSITVQDGVINDK